MEQPHEENTLGILSLSISKAHSRQTTFFQPKSTVEIVGKDKSRSSHKGTLMLRRHLQPDMSSHTVQVLKFAEHTILLF